MVKQTPTGASVTMNPDDLGLHEAFAVLETAIRDRSSLVPAPMGKFVILHGLLVNEPEVGDGEARFLVVDDKAAAEPGWPYRVSVVLAPGTGWVVNRFDPQCTGCFGEGFLRIGSALELCDVCEGLGWGAVRSAGGRVFWDRSAGFTTLNDASSESVFSFGH